MKIITFELAGWLAACLAGWLAGLGWPGLAWAGLSWSGLAWALGWLSGLLAGCLPGWLPGWLAAWLAGWGSQMTPGSSSRRQMKIHDMVYNENHHF